MINHLTIINDISYKLKWQRNFYALYTRLVKVYNDSKRFYPESEGTKEKDKKERENEQSRLCRVGIRLPWYDCGTTQNQSKRAICANLIEPQWIYVKTSFAIWFGIFSHNFYMSSC